MAPAGVEMLVGVVDDPVFGPVIACGAGGVTTELLKDVAVRITPLTERGRARRWSARCDLPAARGLPGRPKADVAALEEMLLRVSRARRGAPGDRGDGPQPRDRESFWRCWCWTRGSGSSRHRRGVRGPRSSRTSLAIPFGRNAASHSGDRRVQPLQHLVDLRSARSPAAASPAASTGG